MLRTVVWGPATHGRYLRRIVSRLAPDTPSATAAELAKRRKKHAPDRQDVAPYLIVTVMACWHAMIAMQLVIQVVAGIVQT
jgi:hypothetical protein